MAESDTENHSSIISTSEYSQSTESEATGMSTSELGEWSDDTASDDSSGSSSDEVWIRHRGGKRREQEESSEEEEVWVRAQN